MEQIAAIHERVGRRESRVPRGEVERNGYTGRGVFFYSRSVSRKFIESTGKEGSSGSSSAAAVRFNHNYTREASLRFDHR